MSWAIEEKLNIVWCLAAVGADVEANNLTDSALVGAEEQGTKQALATRKMRVCKAPVEYPSQYTRP